MAVSMKLLDRAVKLHAATGFIETSGPLGVLMLKWRDGHYSTYYEIRHGLNGRQVLEKTVPHREGQ